MKVFHEAPCDACRKRVRVVDGTDVPDGWILSRHNKDNKILHYQFCSVECAADFYSGAYLQKQGYVER